MAKLTRRSLLRNSFGLVTDGALTRPYIANAAAKTATVWWAQGFAHEEDIAFNKLVADYEKTSGNAIDATVIPYAPGRQKIVAAVTTGVVPDLFQNNPPEITALLAWEDKLVDVGDVVATQREEYADTALALVNCYNNATKSRGIYGVPYTIDVFTNHIWRPLVEKAGHKIDDIPKTWDAFYDFFKDVQKKLREQRVRNVYGLGFQLTTNGGDPNAFFRSVADRLWRPEHCQQGRQIAS
jgi:multiple sugar transport system substrate-binding protein